MSGTHDGGHVPQDVLLALADPIRRRLLSALVGDGGGTSTSLAAPLPVTRQAVAKRLAALERAGLVLGHRTGREVRYTADLRPLRHTTR